MDTYSEKDKNISDPVNGGGAGEDKEPRLAQKYVTWEVRNET